MTHTIMLLRGSQIETRELTKAETEIYLAGLGYAIKMMDENLGRPWAAGHTALRREYDRIEALIK